MIERIFHVYKKIKTVGTTRFYYAAMARICNFQYIPNGTKKNCLAFKRRSIKASFFELNLDNKMVLAEANAYAQNQFALLGVRPASYLQMPWYQDVRLEQSRGNEEYSFDIKVPWELARFQYAPILAHAYQKTKNTQYLESLKKQIGSFLDAAPFLEGIHWRNPMEVAIRAINWILAYLLVQDEFSKDSNFHDRFFQSLSQHMLFIEHNWELYDGRTNNHYLSNLVGYGYLCWLFNDRTRWKHCWKELQKEFDWQIQNDGSSYEGSTAYHGFVTELFLHGLLVAKEMGEIISDQMRLKLKKMIQCADTSKELHIGDDDSGSLLHRGLLDRDKLCEHLEIRSDQVRVPIVQYKNFGLSIIKTDQWDISLRHHSYQPRQPSAHFHEDVGSVTLSYNGIPILVDPGTYLYTGSKKWRNYFRSAQQHNTFYPSGWNQKNDDLFALEIPQAEVCYEQYGQSIQTKHSLYGYQVSRKLKWNEKEILISDDVSFASDEMVWSFIFAPDISLIKKNQYTWDILYKQKYLLSMTSDIIFSKHPSWVSPSYGVKQRSWALQGMSKNNDVSFDTIFRFAQNHSG